MDMLPREFDPEVFPVMYDIYEEIKHLSLAQAREKLREEFSEGWVEEVTEALGRDYLKEHRPSWYLIFKVAGNGDIGRDEMSEIVEKHMSEEHAKMDLGQTVTVGDQQLRVTAPQTVSVNDFFEQLGKCYESMLRIGRAMKANDRAAL
ncbi:hypothetical protein [Alicyclobacillus herbarius]|uniref:hypothetical protein n=1 Tax=Alicyclobacillus herbarius TaxID=122960 RepID=UPI00040DA41F|nr:hypothetical protein [Alicyclobacillus herbarius]